MHGDPRRFSSRIFSGIGLLLLGGCVGGGGALLPDGVSQTVGPMGAEITISAASDPLLAGTTLLIPPGALARNTLITVSRGMEQASVGETPLGTSIRFTPDGLQFAEAATLTLPYRPQAQPANTSVVVAINSQGMKSRAGAGELTVDPRAATVSLEIQHFTDYEPIAIPGVVHGDGGSDGGQTDGGHPDGGRDGGHPDGGPDGGHPDGGPIDGGHFDGGHFDGGPIDGSPEGGGVDGGADDGHFDGGPDLGPFDGGLGG